MDETDQNVISIEALLERSLDLAYITEWTEFLAREKTHELGKNETSVAVFRIGNDWLAINTFCVVEIAFIRDIRPIPHLTNKILKGLVNFRGQLLLCISLGQLLQIEEVSVETINFHKRLMAISKDNEQWVFPVDEVFGVHRFREDEKSNVPVTVSKSASNYLKGVVRWENKNLGVLDEELLFYSLRTKLL